MLRSRTRHPRFTRENLGSPNASQPQRPVHRPIPTETSGERSVLLEHQYRNDSLVTSTEYTQTRRPFDRLVIAHVCRHWRTIARALPYLWSHVGQDLTQLHVVRVAVARRRVAYPRRHCRQRKRRRPDIVPLSGVYAVYAVQLFRDDFARANSHGVSRL